VAPDLERYRAPASTIANRLELAGEFGFFGFMILGYPTNPAGWVLLRNIGIVAIQM
jgi:hypothetical protein